MKKMLSFIISCFLLSGFAFSQDFASIKGKIIDESGSPLPGVTVTLTGEFIAPMVQITSEQGGFDFSTLPDGKGYVLKAELSGFETVIQSALDLSSGQDIQLTLTLEQISLQEEAVVVAVEVPVRVVRDGQIVRGLTGDDFEVYEDGVLQKITAFDVVSRKIIHPDDESAGAQQEASPKRLFILVFNIFDYNESVEEAIDHFFSQIFRSGDQVLIVTEGALLNIEKGKGLSDLVQNLKMNLQEYKTISTAAISNAFKELRYEADRLQGNLQSGGRTGSQSLGQAIVNFYDNYRRLWLEYKARFVTPDLALYQSIIKRIKQIEGEKWTLCFQQREMFPKLINESSLERNIKNYLDASTADPLQTTMQRTIRAKQWELYRQFNASGDIPAESMRDIFMEANITFHLILLRSVKAHISQDFEMREVGSEYEDNLKKISFSTGGTSIFSNKVKEALQDASEAEDYFYLLVYSPHDTPSNQERKIEVNVNSEDAEIIYLKKIPKLSAPPVQITGFQVLNKTVSFNLNNYQMAKLDGKTKGIAEVKVTIFDSSSEVVFEEGRNLELNKEETHIALNFGHLSNGQYFIVIQVVDRIANETDVYSGSVVF